MAAIVCSDLSFSWPDGAPVLSALTASFGSGRTGLIGVNGSGKSTLLRLVAGELRPRSGTVRADGDVGYLPQAITLRTHRTVSDLLGITAAREALHAIEAGEMGEEAFAAVGDAWDVEERARAWLDRLGLPLSLDDRVQRLSGGETVLVALAALFVRRPDVMLLDEPTNNLDLDARGRLYDAVSLARFLFRGERADRVAGTLSGGERFRAVLAALLLARPAPQLLLLDEPTNSLDMASARQLSQALEGYRGAILVASHDVPFLRSAGITRWLRVDRDTGLTVIEPL